MRIMLAEHNLIVLELCLHNKYQLYDIYSLKNINRLHNLIYVWTKANILESYLHCQNANKVYPALWRCIFDLCVLHWLFRIGVPEGLRFDIATRYKIGYIVSIRWFYLLVNSEINIDTMLASAACMTASRTQTSKNIYRVV